MERVRGVVDVKNGVVVSGPNVAIAPAPGRGAARRSPPRSWPARVSRRWPGSRSARSCAARAPGRCASCCRRPSGPDGAHGARRRWRSRCRGGRGRDARRPRARCASIRARPRSRATTCARMVSVTARLSGRDLGSAMAEIQRRLPREVVAPAAGERALRRAVGRAAVLVPRAARRPARARPRSCCSSCSSRSARGRRCSALLAVVLASLAGVFAALHADRLDLQHLELRRRHHGGRHRGGERLLPARRPSRARCARGSTPAAAAPAAAARRARPVLMTTLAGVAALAPLAFGLGSRRRAAAPARDRRGRRIHALGRAAARRAAVAARPLGGGDE